MSEWIVQVEDEHAVEQLRTALNFFEWNEQSLDRDIVFVLVEWLKNLRVEIFSNEHPPPHFRVRCDGETANYRIDNCEQLNGGLRRQYSVVKKWHAQNKLKLIEAWNSRRPRDCPVGFYRES